MRQLIRILLATVAVGLAGIPGLRASDTDLIPPQFPEEQRARLQRFLRDHEKPDRFVPANARFVGGLPGTPEPTNEDKPGQAVKQYLVQITPHRPVPGQEEVRRVDVIYYRPNPQKGKPGIAVRHTVDVTTGKQVGETEVLLNGQTPLAREELAEAVALAKEKAPAVQELYKQENKDAVRWEYLQLLVGRKHPPHEPGDRVVSLLFTAPTTGDQAAPTTVRVVVNLTRGVVVPGTP